MIMKSRVRKPSNKVQNAHTRKTVYTFFVFYNWSTKKTEQNRRFFFQNRTETESATQQNHAGCFTHSMAVPGTTHCMCVQQSDYSKKNLNYSGLFSTALGGTSDHGSRSFHDDIMFIDHGVKCTRQTLAVICCQNSWQSYSQYGYCVTIGVRTFIFLLFLMFFMYSVWDFTIIITC